MAYSPENNPYIPGDPACYDLKWMVQEINAAKAVREQAEGSAAAATASAEAAAASAERAGDWEADARLYAQNAETSAGNAAASAQDAGALVGPLNNRMTTIESRMDTFTQLPAGSTSGDAELQDIRVGADGTTYPTAGDAVRSQVSSVKSDIDLINNGFYKFKLIPNKYILRDNGREDDYNGWSATDFIELRPKHTLVCHTSATLSWGARYDADKTYIEPYGWTEGAFYFNITEETVYFRISAATGTMENVRFELLPPVDTTLSKYGYPAEAKTVGNRLSAIEVLTDPIPSYYETQLATKEATIRGYFDNCANNGDGLVFLTDTHFSSDLFTSVNPTSYFNANHSFALIKDVIAKCAIDKIVFGGDLVNSTPDVDTMLLCMAKFGNRWGTHQKRLRYCVGNHEYFTGNDFGQTTKPTASELYGAGIKYNEDIVLAKGDMNTYYFDNKVQKIRYFIVSCGRDTETTTTQVAWILNQFREVPENYKIVVIGHAFLADNMTAFRGGYKPIADALDAVKAGTTFTYNSITYDYSELNNVTVVCMISGHTHIDGSLTTSGGIPCICTTTDSYKLNSELVDGTPTISPRTIDTVDEQAFDIIQFDFTNRKIYCTRIGYGSDREFSY